LKPDYKSKNVWDLNIFDVLKSNNKWYKKFLELSKEKNKEYEDFILSKLSISELEEHNVWLKELEKKQKIVKSILSINVKENLLMQMITFLYQLIHDIYFLLSYSILIYYHIMMIDIFHFLFLIVFFQIFLNIS